MICGDMNSRNGCLLDYIIEYDTNDDMNSDRTCEPTNIKPRASEDNVVNEHGTILIDLCT